MPFEVFALLAAFEQSSNCAHFAQGRASSANRLLQARPERVLMTPALNP